MNYFLAAAVIVTAIAAVADLRKASSLLGEGEMPNWLTAGPIFVAPIAHALMGFAIQKTWHATWVEGGSSLLGAVSCAVVPGLLYRQDAIGGGDLKLLVGVGAMLQPHLGLEAEMYAFFAAGLIAPAFLAYEGKLFRTIKNTALLALNPLLPKRKRKQVEPTLLTWFRFGPAIFLGTALAAYLNWRR